MTDRAWLEQFLDQAVRNPGPLVRTIASARGGELTAAAAALKLIPNPSVQVLGYAALGSRSREQREEFLARAAESTELLADPASRVGALTALIDALPSHEAEQSQARILQLLEELSPNEREHFLRILVHRSKLGVKPPKNTPSFQLLPEMRIDPDALAWRLAKAHIRMKPDADVARIRAIGRPTGPSSPIRIKEIATSVGIDPTTLVLMHPMIHAKPVSLAMPGAIGEPMPQAGAEAAAASSTMANVAKITRPERVVSTGFADESGQAVGIVVRPGELHHFFVEVGARVEGAAESEHALPEYFGAASVIDVVMFTNDDGLTIEGPETGRLRIEESGAVVVVQRASVPAVDDGLLRRRLFFGFRALPVPGECSMRCSFYCRGILIQSRDIMIPVGIERPSSVMVDFVLSRTLSPDYEAQLDEPRLSVMLNDNADGTHSFRFYGEGGRFLHSSTFGPLELKNIVDLARKGFRLAAWGTQEEWQTTDAYRFRTPRTIDSVMPDLVDLAHRGRVVWDVIIDKLAGGPDAGVDLHKAMRQPGNVQFVLREAARSILPISILYDHEFDTSLSPEDMEFCATFVRSLGGDLTESACLQGDCPNRDRVNVVCPSGFWGFRHTIGMPLSIGADQSSPPDIRPDITSDDPSFTVGVSTDPMMSGRVLHLMNLELKTEAPQDVKEVRDETLAAMKSGGTPIVYFYCHGGIHDIDGPYIEVGPRDGPRIARNNLYGIRWREVRPIVFINGCHTTRVSPDEAIELVSAFVSRAGASGVIGTEITVFESLASRFAEAFFREFVKEGRRAGDALRRARLRILKDSLNPLGLVYIPFVDSSLRLRQPA